MSAFIVSDTGMNNVVSAILAHGQDFDYEFHGSAIHPTNMTAIGRALFDLNNESMRQRYGQKEEIDNYEFIRVKPSEFQTLMSIRCLLYQCSEGNVCETPMYKELQILAYYVARDIVDELPQYKLANWD